MLAGGIDPAQLARFSSLPIKARVIVEGALSGLHRANVHGSSVEFAEHKEYSQGDELRHVDWKAYGKLDRYYVKQFEQESQLTTHLVLDASASMSFKGGSAITKLEYGSLMLAALAYLVIQQQDKVGFAASGNGAVDVLVPPRGRTNHLHDLLGVVEQVTRDGGKGHESPAQALARIAEQSRRRKALVVIASDLFDSEDETMAACAALRAQKHDVSVLHVIDPHERTFPYDGLTQFEALESNHRLLVNPAAIKKDYLERMESFLAGAKKRLVTAGVDYHFIQTDRALDHALLDLLITRSRLMPRGGR